MQVVAQYRSQFREDLARSMDGAVDWISCDLSDAFELGVLASRSDIEGCIHTAAVPDDRLARPDPLAAHRSHVDATAALLEIARRGGWRPVVLLSTGSVF